MAQNVYSLNVVGYVNVTCPPAQFTAIANPLDATMGGTVANGNQLSNILTEATAPTLAASSTIATFNPALNNYDANIVYSGKSKTWGSSIDMPPGKAALFYNNGAAATVITFAGQVVQGSYAVATLPAAQFSLVGSPVPIGGDVTNATTAVGLVPSASDTIATFNSGANNWNNSVSWSAKSKTWSGAMPVAAGEGFLYYNNGAAANAWVSNFTVQ